MSEPFFYDRDNPVVVVAGSLIFCDSPDLIGWAIRLGQRIRWRPTCQWNHVAIAIEAGTNPLVVQATIDGVTGNRTLSTLKGGAILVVPPLSDVDADLAIEFAESQEGDKYGWFTLFGVVVDQLSPDFLQFQIGRDGTWICSALAAECWRAGGWIQPWRNIYQVAPAELALAVGVDPSLIFP